MKKIGEGWYYDVFDLENDRVLKKRKDFTSIAAKFDKAFFLRGIYKWFKGYNYAVKCAWATGRMKERIKKSFELAKILGNPVFVSDTNYEQDKVRIIADSLSGILEEDKKIIDSYIKSIFVCWENAFSDRIYNFSINNGYNSWNDLILIDFNEVTFLKNEVLKDILEKRWEKSWSAKQIDQKLQNYYFEQMALQITPEALNKYWRQFYPVK